MISRGKCYICYICNMQYIYHSVLHHVSISTAQYSKPCTRRAMCTYTYAHAHTGSQADPSGA